jgi:hypothetical protein
MRRISSRSGQPAASLVTLAMELDVRGASVHEIEDRLCQEGASRGAAEAARVRAHEVLETEIADLATTA